MSILIKGMEMPSCCMFCPLSNSCGCGLTNPPVLMTSKEMLADRPDWCPLVSVPPHWRLIDADELMKTCGMATDCYDCPNGEYGWCKRSQDAANICEAIDDAPTIIPAEEGE